MGLRLYNVIAALTSKCKKSYTLTSICGPLRYAGRRITGRLQNHSAQNPGC